MLPTSSSDILISFTCRTCLGQGGFGVRGDTYNGKRTNNFQDCSACDGTGWEGRRTKELTPAEADRVRAKLAPIPPDTATEYERTGTREHITAALSNFAITAVSFPDEDATTSIDLTNKRGVTLRIFPEFSGGKLRNLNVIAPHPDTIQAISPINPIPALLTPDP